MSDETAKRIYTVHNGNMAEAVVERETAKSYQIARLVAFGFKSNIPKGHARISDTRLGAAEQWLVIATEIEKAARIKLHDARSRLGEAEAFVKRERAAAEASR